MANFVVETFVPAEDRSRFARSVEALRAATGRSRDGLRVRHVRSFLVPGDEMGFHVLEAVTAIEIARLAEAAGIEIERVVEVVTIDGPDMEEDT
jgi:hypothetical protein